MFSTQAACVVTSIAPQLAIIFNSLIVSRFLGVEYFKAISFFTPITGMILLLINICTIGPSVQAGTAYGKLDFKMSNQLLTLSISMAALVGCLAAFAILIFRRTIVGNITSDLVLTSQLLLYAASLVLFLLLSTLSSFLNSFVTAAGHASKVTLAMLSASAINVLSIFLLIKAFGFGVVCSGIAMCLAALTNILFLLPLALGRRFPFRFAPLQKSLLSLFKHNVVFWISLNSGALCSGMMQFVTNIVVLYFLSSEGLFAWGICLLALSAIAYTYAGIADAYIYVDAYLIGEADSNGRLKIARSFLVESIVILTTIAILFSCFSDTIALLFGADNLELARSVRTPLICVAWYASLRDFLATFGIFSIHRHPAVKLTYDILACCMPPLLSSLVALLSGSANFWYGFAIAPLVLLLYVFLANMHYCRKDKSLIPFFLFNRFGDSIHLDISIQYTPQSLQESMDHIRKFLKICEINDSFATKIEVCCEELMNNILAIHYRGNTFDLRLMNVYNYLTINVRSLGHPISPSIPNNIVQAFVQEGKIPDSADLSLFYIKRSCDKIDYHYVHGMNATYLRFDKQSNIPQINK